MLRGEATPGGGRLLVYLFAVQVAVYLSGPYFVPFMFRHMHVEYRDYALLMGLNFIGKVIAMPLCNAISCWLPMTWSTWACGSWANIPSCCICS